MTATPKERAHAGCITLDLRQAFDMLILDYIFPALELFGIPPGYLMWVRLLYKDPTARARTGRHISEEYPV